MNDERRPDPSELEWPSEDLAQVPRAEQRPDREVEWPSEDADARPASGASAAHATPSEPSPAEPPLRAEPPPPPAEPPPPPAEPVRPAEPIRSAEPVRPAEPIRPAEPPAAAKVSPSVNEVAAPAPEVTAPAPESPPVPEVTAPAPEVTPPAPEVTPPAPQVTPPAPEVTAPAPEAAPPAPEATTPTLETAPAYEVPAPEVTTPEVTTPAPDLTAAYEVPPPSPEIVTPDQQPVPQAQEPTTPAEGWLAPGQEPVTPAYAMPPPTPDTPTAFDDPLASARATPTYQMPTPSYEAPPRANDAAVPGLEPPYEAPAPTYEAPAPVPQDYVAPSPPATYSSDAATPPRIGPYSTDMSATSAHLIEPTQEDSGQHQSEAIATSGAFGAYDGPTPIEEPDQAGPYAFMRKPDTPDGDEAEREARRTYFRPDIEGLRAVAIIAVLLFHIGVPLAGGGFVGVDVFFVISGFLITGLLLREGESAGKVDLIAFYARRMRRLLPAALLVIIVTLALSAVIVSPLRLTEIAGDAAASALYVANFRFAIEATNYLAVEAPSPLLHYWSLGVEEQFYLVWPLILLVAVRFLPSRGVGIFLLVLALASFALSFYWTDAAPAWAFFSPFTRAWQLAAGALIAVGFITLPARAPRGTAPALALLGIGLIVAAVVLLSATASYPGIASILPVGGAMLVIIAGVSGPNRASSILLANPLSRYIGRISYSLYLWHWPLLILIPIAIGSDDAVVRWALAGLAVVLAAVSTELVEQPFRKSGALQRRSAGTVQLGIAGSVAVGAFALLMTGSFSLPIPAPQPDRAVLALAEARRDLPSHYGDGCHLQFDGTKPVDCAYGDPDGEKLAVLYGDSHAAQWFPAIREYAEDQGWRLEVHTKSACSPAPVNLFERKLRRVYNECIKWRKAVNKRIRDAEPYVVFLGSSRDYDIMEGGRLMQSRDIYPYWQERLTRMVQVMDERADKVVLLAETPYLNFDPIDCLADPDVSNCDPAAFLSIDREYAGIEAAAASAGGAQLLSINDILCPGISCPTVVEDIVVFRDNHHLTDTFMEHLATPIGNLLEGRAPFPTPVPSPAASGEPASGGGELVSADEVSGPA